MSDALAARGLPALAEAQDGDDVCFAGSKVLRLDDGPIFCNLLSTLPWFIRQDPQAYLLYASGLLSGLGAGAGPLSFAMMVDIIPGDMREQGFPVM